MCPHHVITSVFARISSLNSMVRRIQHRRLHFHFIPQVLPTADAITLHPIRTDLPNCLMLNLMPKLVPHRHTDRPYRRNSHLLTFNCTARHARINV